MRSPSGKVSAPIGTIMNSWASTLFDAWAPPFRMFIMGTGQHPRHRSAEIAVQRQAAVLGGRTSHGERHAEDCVGAELALVGRAVGIHHLGVDLDLVRGGPALEPRAQHLVHVAHRLGHALPERSAWRRRRAAPPPRARPVEAPLGHRRPSLGAAREDHLGFDRRVAAAIQDLASVDFDDGGHVLSGRGNGRTVDGTAPNLAGLPGPRQPKWLNPRSSTGLPARTEARHRFPSTTVTDAVSGMPHSRTKRSASRQSRAGSATSSS